MLFRSRRYRIVICGRRDQPRKKKPGRARPGNCSRRVEVRGGDRGGVDDRHTRSNPAYTDMKLDLQPLATTILDTPAFANLLGLPGASPASTERSGVDAAAVGMLTIERSLSRILRDRVIVNLHIQQCFELQGHSMRHPTPRQTKVIRVMRDDYSCAAQMSTIHCRSMTISGSAASFGRFTK